MKNSKLTKIIAMAICSISISSLVSGIEVQAASNGEIDKAYAKAYNTTMKAKDSKAQKSINIARLDVASFRKLAPASTLTSTLSRILDSVQQPRLSNIIISILSMKDSVSVSQVEINSIRTLMEGDQVDNTDDLPVNFDTYKKTWNSEVDAFQGILINKAMSSVVTAESEKTQKSIDTSMILVADLNTAVRPGIKNIAKGLQDRLSKIDIGNHGTPVVIEEIPYEIRMLEPDSIGKRYMETSFTNNSKYPIKGFSMTILLKDTNEKTYLSNFDTVMPGEKSSNFRTFAPKGGDAEKMEILKYNITAIKEDGSKVFVEYDAKLKTYSWY
ncbi:hypothetical protein [Clostridium gasigenes]|uniref:DUF5105 domain-containing protein n=1 Tax=Clostridium gasigenes TaxID=94869 RepID=A0A7X0SE80_9CLOT|nr:hypothetical protein [Clostridium gasigenes]MBB6715962.1 hypothetical protein [Clostridium gasigenes]